MPQATEIAYYRHEAVDWVGIDGDDAIGDDMILQVGTGVTEEVTREYYGWYEAATTLQSSKHGTFHQLSPKEIKISPGDLILAGVEETSPGSHMWVLDIDNMTTHKQWYTTVSFQGPGLTAEVIHENPTQGDNPGNFEDTEDVTFMVAAFNHEPIDFLPMALFPDVTLYQLRFADGEATASALKGACFTVADTRTAPSPPSFCET